MKTTKTAAELRNEAIEALALYRTKAAAALDAKTDADALQKTADEATAEAEAATAAAKTADENAEAATKAATDEATKATAAALIEAAKAAHKTADAAKAKARRATDAAKKAAKKAEAATKAEAVQKKAADEAEADAAKAEAVQKAKAEAAAALDALPLRELLVQATDAEDAKKAAAAMNAIGRRKAEDIAEAVQTKAEADAVKSILDKAALQKYRANYDFIEAVKAEAVPSYYRFSEAAEEMTTKEGNAGEAFKLLQGEDAKKAAEACKAIASALAEDKNAARKKGGRSHITTKTAKALHTLLDAVGLPATDAKTIDAAACRLQDATVRLHGFVGEKATDASREEIVNTLRFIIDGGKRTKAYTKSEAIEAKAMYIVDFIL